MFTVQQSIETLSTIQACLLQGNAAQALSFTSAALKQSQEEQAEFESWLEREAMAEEAWRLHGHQLCKDLNSYPESVEAEEVPF